MVRNVSSVYSPQLLLGYDGTPAWDVSDDTLYREIEAVGSTIDLEQLKSKLDPAPESAPFFEPGFFESARGLMHTAVRWKATLSEWGANAYSFLECEGIRVRVMTIGHGVEAAGGLEAPDGATFAEYRYDLLIENPAHARWLALAVDRARGELEGPPGAFAYEREHGNLAGFSTEDPDDGEWGVLIGDAGEPSLLAGNCGRVFQVEPGADAATLAPDALARCLDSLMSLHTAGVETRALGCAYRHFTSDVVSAAWLSMGHAMHKSRAVTCKACGRSMLVSGERGKPREYCCDNCRKWAHRNPGRMRSPRGATLR